MDAELQAQIEVCDKTFFEKLGSGGHQTRSYIYPRLAKSWLYTIEQIWHLTR